MWKRLLTLSLLLSLASVCALAADDKPKPNTLTPKEAADGWLLLFDGETTFGWLPDGKNQVKDEHLIVSGGNYATCTTPFAQFELRFEYHSNADATLTTGFGPVELAFPLRRTEGETWSQATLRLEAASASFTRGGANEKPATEKVVPPNEYKSAIFSFLAGKGENTSFLVRNIKLKPLGEKPLFNGKDLTGWKEFPGKKSKFSVSKDGTIDIKDGPGDLQTVAQYQDFVLQAECLSNGKHLNSGIFFRCLPDQYQNGYEAQIHNGWTEKPEKEYTIEEYDPKTNELKGKEKIKSASLDYGTGAIYRRIPARKAVAKDNEWFTMTIAAQGRHLATWVNGIQVVDWTDNRPLKDNARNGCKLEKGAISLQGHDPTTDLSFRNIRLSAF